MQIAIGTYDHTRALKDGSVGSPKLPLEFVEVAPITRAFRAMASDLAYDISEMALCTYMLAKVLDRPIVALPIVLVRSAILGSLVTAGDITEPAKLNGQTLGIRSYTQTTGVWVRGILQDQFGVDLGSLRWVTQEGAHLDAYQDPANVQRAPEGSSMDEMLRSGQLAAAIGVPARDGIHTLLPDPAAAEAAYAERTGVKPVNHVVAIKRELLPLRDDIIDLFQRARDRNGSSAVPPIGIEPSRPAFEALTRYAFEQGITPRKLSVDELFE
jgi:4,5-dihydroxyphthalate decarboxylase